MKNKNSHSLSKLKFTIMKKILTLFAFISILISITDTARAQTILYVNANAMGTNNGSSWTNAYIDLQSALTAATLGDQIWVAAGTYKPSAHPAACTGCSGPRDYTFQLKDGVSLYGGFAGTETILSQRDWNNNITILSGDFNDDDVVTGSGSSLIIPGNSENAHHVVIAVFSDVTSTTRLDGFTITGGSAFGSSSITVNTVSVLRNFGGGIYTSGGTNMLMNNSLSGNSASSGGGIFTSQGTNTLKNNRLSENLASLGGGIYMGQGTNTLSNNKLLGNRASGSGGGMITFQSTNTLTNNILSANSATVYGGGICSFGGTYIYTNNSLSGNSASIGGGMYTDSGTNTLTNNIIWGNNSQVINNNSTLTITYSIMQFGFPGIGNLDEDPLFADPENGDLRLTSGSPGIDAGTANGAPATDLDDKPRPIGVGYDMGAYEFGIPCPTGNILYVKADAMGINDGSSWTDAYTDLQSALVNTCPDITEIWVATGTYKPSAHPASCTGCSGPRDYTFQLKDGVSLYGGFAGTETLLSQRDWENNITILSGDFNDDDVVTGSGSSLSITGNSENAHHVVLAAFSDVTSTTRLDGFTITGGNANGSSIMVNMNVIFHDFGGGIHTLGGTNTLTNNILSGNLALGYGGGIYTFQGTNTLTNNILSRNSAPNGGGIYTREGNNNLTNNILSDNRANRGGGIYTFQGTNTLTNNIVSGNRGESSGGGIHAQGGTNSLMDNSVLGNFSLDGGGIYTREGTNMITNNSVSGNTATSVGGGIATLLCNSTLTNNLVSGNNAFNGGGIFTVQSTNSLTNNSIYGNVGRNSGGGVYTAQGINSLSNNIIWGNNSGIFNNNSTLTITYSVVQGGFAGEGNLNVDPLFVDRLNGDLRLLACSPAINTGSNAAIPMGITTDLDGNNRIVDGTIDMGAYEFQDKLVVANCQNQNIMLDASGQAIILASSINNNSTGCGNLSFTANGEVSLTFTCDDIGQNSITLLVTDTRGETDTCLATVTIIDQIPPTISCPAPQTLVLDADCEAVLPDYTMMAISDDNCGVDNVSQSPIAGTEVSGTGDMTVTLTVTDVNGLTNTCNFTVTKVDNIPPSISCPANQTIVLDGDCEATLPDYTTMATSEDNCGVQGVIQSPIAVTTVSESGNMTITLIVTDVNGLTNTCNFTVTKLDNITPSIECFNQTIIFNGETNISLDPNDLVEASDNCGVQNTSLSQNSIPSTQVGQTIPVNVTVTDINNNSATCISQITVSGLPPGWSQNSNGVGCADGNNIEYNAATAVWTATSTNCYYSSPFTSDATAFAQRTLCGDGSIIAQVTGISGTSLGWAGVIMRENNLAGAKKAQLTTNMSNFSRREFRVNTGGTAHPQQFPSQNRRWLRIERSGNQFAMYVSHNGISWAFAGAQNIQMNSCIEIGLVVSNYNSNSTVSATFANVSVTGGNLSLIGGGPESLAQDDHPNFRNVNVFPNPTSGELNISLSGYEGRSVTLEVFNTMGQILYIKELDEVQNADEIIDLSSVASGMYLLRVSSDGLLAEMKRVTVAR